MLIVGDIVRLHRIERSMKQEELGEKIFRDAPYVCRLEKGKEDLSPDMLRRLAKILDSEILEYIALGKLIKPVLQIN